MFVLSPIICREPSFRNIYSYLTSKLQLDGQGFEELLMLENGISSIQGEYQSDSEKLYKNGD